MFHMTEEQKTNVINNFKKVIDKQNPDLINKNLYYHLNLNCNFIAHFNLNGFREHYRNNFREFIEKFDPNSPESDWINAPEISTQFRSLNEAMMEYMDIQSISRTIQ